MAVNALGQNIKILLNAAPDKDLGLRLGDLLRARVVDLLPDNRAIIEVRGRNLLADLSGLSNSGALSRGAFLDLAVGQAPAQSGVSLSLKLLKVSGGEAPGILGSLGGSTTGQIPALSLEDLLIQAQIPVTNANLRAAQSLGQYGLPVDKAMMNSLNRSADLLLGVEDLAGMVYSGAKDIAAGVAGGTSLQDPALGRALQRELASALIQEARTAAPSPLDQAGLERLLDSMARRLAAGTDPSAEKIFESARSQGDFGAAVGTPQMRQAALGALAEMRSVFVARPLDHPVNSAPALADAFRARGLGAPQVALNTVPRETLLEALAFLRARGLPPSRPLVETVVMGLAHEGGDLGRTLGAIMAAQDSVKPTPGLLQAFSSLGQFLAEHRLDMEDPVALRSRTMDFVDASGIDLEKVLLEGETASAVHPADSLKGRLLHLAAALRETAEDASGRPNPGSERLARDISQAISTLDTMNLATRPTPAFDVTTLQLPVFMDGQLQSGQLSVYWKKGRPHQLDEKDPVNVAFVLNTSALGEVKVHLQVWKDECQCRVNVQDAGSRDLMKDGADSLRKGFEANTRFKLSGLDFASAGELAALAVRGLGLLEDQPRPGSLNLRA